MKNEFGFEPEEVDNTSEESSKLESLGKGIQQGGTLGFSDEISGGVQAALDKLAPLFGQPSLQEQAKKLTEQGFVGDIGPTDIYTEARDEERNALSKAKQDNPYSFLGGEILGSSVVPLGSMGKGAKLSDKVLKGAKAGALAGGLTSAGTSQEMPEIGDVIKSAGLGATIGGGLPLVGAALKSTGNALKNTQSAEYLKDLIKKTRAGVEFGGDQALANLRGKALSSTKDIITQVDRSNLNKIKARDELFSKIKDIDVKEETVNLLDNLDQLKQDAAATAKPIVDATEKQIINVFKKGSKITGEDYRILEDKLQENIQKAADSKDIRLQKLLEQYQNLVKEKVYSSSPELGGVRRSIRDENEMLKLLTGEAAPDFAKLSPAEMEKMAEQALTRLEAPAGTTNYAQSQKFFEGVDATPGIRASKIPGFQDMGKSLKLSDDLRNLELSKKLNREGISQGSVSGTGVLSAATGGLMSLAGQGAVTIGKGLKNMDKISNDLVRNQSALDGMIPKLLSSGKQSTANMFKAISDSPDIKKRQALIFAALQQPNVRKDLEDLGFNEEATVEGTSDENSGR